MDYTTDFPRHLVMTKVPRKMKSMCCDINCTESYLIDDIGTLSVFNTQTKRIVYRTTLPSLGYKILVSAKAQFLLFLDVRMSLHVYRILRPFRLLEIDSIPNTYNFVFTSDCDKSPLSFVTLSIDRVTLTQYTYFNGQQQVANTKKISFVAAHLVTNPTFSEIAVASNKEVIILSSDLLTLHYEDLNFRIAGVAYSGELLFALAGCCLKNIEKDPKEIRQRALQGKLEKISKDVHLPLGDPTVITSHQRHIVVGDRNKIYAIDTRSGRVAFVSKLPPQALVYNIFTNEKMNLFVAHVLNLPVVVEILSDDMYAQESGLLKSVELKDYKVVFANIPESQTTRNNSDLPPSVPASTYSVFVGKFGDNLTAKDVKDAFQSSFGPVLKVRTFPGHCFVDFKDDISMNKALKHHTFMVGQYEVTINVASKNSKR
ncbi:hypothetical protein EIN_404470 [Entamoeba invadens IP1]|uniref:RRM domain-containing protein n=1 Tax=Entamoeba invadens IP1 TaxID=370355 RepID=A0A0A1U6K6_ENTIV|nr:hypothetical protein EIN_404470 [Entamoeba invadens IP1]ELP90053.1 hypothetical protein EIN_404470 [Entamoeba invadens IP1]|eukprot:XP_004256824.1 hypothetical protein EIN_404470 [Entamoeba invadens IP1]